MNQFTDLKPYLIEYLRKKGIPVMKAGTNIRCFSLAHRDPEPSCNIKETSFFCYGCGIKGDILDAASILEGIPRGNKKAQIEAVCSTLGGINTLNTIKFPARKILSDFIPDEKSQAILRAYMEEQTIISRERMIYFFTDHRKHSRESAERMIDRGGALYWPGRMAAIHDNIDPKVMDTAGMMSRDWQQPGIIVPLRTGFTLHYPRGERTMKIRSKGARAFNPGIIPGGGLLVIVEGELDAMACRSVGIPAVCAGGIHGVRRKAVQDTIDSLQRFTEIVILFDNDSGKQTKDGKEKEVQTRKAAFQTARTITDMVDIKVSIAFPPEPGADPEDMVKLNEIEELKKCLEKGILYVDDKGRVIEEAWKKAGKQDLPFTLAVSLDELARGEEIKLLYEITTHRAAAEILKQAINGKVLFVENEKQFYFFNGNRYEKVYNLFSIAYSILFEVTCHYWEALERRESKSQFVKIVRCIGNAVWIRHTLFLLSKEKGIFRQSIPWDSPEIRETLTLRDGVLDFSGPELLIRKGIPGEYRKNYLPYDLEDFESEKSPMAFIQFLSDVFPDTSTLEMAIFYQALLISGNPYYRKFGIAWGPPRTGKSTWIEIIEKVLTGLTVQINPDVIAPRKQHGTSGNGATPEVAKMEGKRVVFATETEQGCMIAGSEVKKLTGGDKLTARELYRNPKEFEPTHQLCLITNFLPHLNCGDTALIDRIVIIPFQVQFMEKDEKTKPRERIIAGIIKESPLIIKYLIDMYIQLRDELKGILPVSPESENLKNQYVKDEDDIGRFVNDCCVIRADEDTFETSDKIARAYRNYFDMDEREISTKKIVSLLNRRYVEIKTGRKWIEAKRLSILYHIKLKHELAGDYY